jgi:putative endonuclease
VRERRKEPWKGSEIEPEIVCVQGVGAPHRFHQVLHLQQMHYLYVLRSEQDGTFYVGVTDDLNRRLAQHNDGFSNFTSKHKPWKLIYYEAYTSLALARKREEKLKNHARGFQELKKRILDESGEG